MTETVDVYTYSGEINPTGYNALCDALIKTSERAILVLATGGGNPHAGFRIARAMQHHYGKFEALVPRYCKSAGTLVLLGASMLWLDDKSELGPLDVQVKKEDEIVGRNSGLDILQAVNYLQDQTMRAFREYVVELTGVGLSTRVAADISSKLTTGLFSPIAAQVDPMKLSEMQRATEIAYAYGERLANAGGNLRANGISNLVASYPSHGFVIDRKEARTLFLNVEKPDGMLAELSQALHADMWPDVASTTPSIKKYRFPLSPPQQHSQESIDEAAPDAAGGAASSQASERQEHGDSASHGHGQTGAPTAAGGAPEHDRQSEAVNGLAKFSA